MTVKLSEIATSKGSLNIRETWVNYGPGDVWLLTWRIPWEGRMSASLFDVRANAWVQAPYVGIQAKRRPPTIKDYIRLQSGHSLCFDVDLAKFYRLAPGQTYSISPEVMDVRQVDQQGGLGAEILNVECSGLVAKMAQD